MYSSVSHTTCLLTSDDDFHLASHVKSKLEQSLRIGISHRKDTITYLYQVKAEIEESYDKHKKATIGGTVGTVTGSILGIAGVTAGFFTFGAGFIVAIVGASLAAAGGTTIAGAQIGYHVVSSSLLKNVDQAIERDRVQAAEIERYGKELDSYIKNLSTRHGICKDTVYVQLKYYDAHESLARNAALLVYNIGRFAEVAGDITRLATSAAAVGRTAATGTRLAATGLRTVGGILSVGSIVLDVVFLPIDIGVMFKASYDVHKYRTTGESNSDAAKKTKEVILVLEENLNGWKAILNDLQTEPPRESPDNESDSESSKCSHNCCVVFCCVCCNNH